MLDYLQAHRSFEGTATDLLQALDQDADETTRKQRQAKNSGWPKSARGISGKLRRLAPNLRQLGYEVELDLPNRAFRLGTQTTVSTVATVDDENNCDSLRYGSDGSNGQIHTQSKQVCDCGQDMIPSVVVDGWQNWDCLQCKTVRPIQMRVSPTDQTPVPQSSRLETIDR